jgi:hypothetical protein
MNFLRVDFWLLFPDYPLVHYNSLHVQKWPLISGEFNHGFHLFQATARPQSVRWWAIHHVFWSNWGVEHGYIWLKQKFICMYVIYIYTYVIACIRKLCVCM